MNWIIRLQAGPVLGPATEDQVRQWAKEGRIGPDDVASPDNGKTWSPAKAVPVFQSTFSTLEAEAPRAPNAAAMMMQESIVWKEMAQERDEFARLARHWQAQYEETQQAMHRMQGELEARIRDLESRELAAQTELDHTRRDVASLRKQVEDLSKPGLGAEDEQALINGYHSLSRNYAHLADQVEAKDRDIHAGREAAEEIRQSYAERLKSTEAQVALERNLALAAQRRFASLEASYLEMVKSLREMNDRYISMRDRVRKGGDASSPAGEAGPRVRLQR